MRPPHFMPTISIAMATYNGAKFIREQLASLAAQTRLPHEIVVSDDCSTDATVSIIEDFAATVAFPVRLHRNPTNIGVARNFERALRACSGGIVFICDQDDFW